MTSKNETGAFIKYFGNTRYELTEPEMKVRGILTEQNFGSRLQEPITIYDQETGKHWTLKPDMFIVEHRIAILVDGIVHKTKKQDSKNNWRVAGLNALGIKVLIIDADWTEIKYGYPSKFRVALSDALLKLKAGSMREELR